MSVYPYPRYLSTDYIVTLQLSLNPVIAHSLGDLHSLHRLPEAEPPAPLLTAPAAGVPPAHRGEDALTNDQQGHQRWTIGRELAQRGIQVNDII